MLLLPVFEKQERAVAVIRVAIVIAVDEVRPDFSQVACSDWLIAHHTGGLRAGRPAIHQDESHVAPPSSQQRQLPRMSLHKSFTAQAPCSGIPNFGKLPREFRRDRCQAAWS